MKCQACDKAATHHVTEIAAGKPVAYHLCDVHLDTLDELAMTTRGSTQQTGFGALLVVGLIAIAAAILLTHLSPR
jgi:hypothetical protein